MRPLLILFFLIFGLNLYSQRKEDTVKLDMNMMAQNLVYDSNEVDELAHFPGGEVAWEKYLLANLKYPKIPEKGRKIYLSFVVEKDGRITDAVITYGLNAKYDEEALRLLRSSGKWIPATVKTKKVRSKGNIFIKFGAG